MTARADSAPAQRPGRLGRALGAAVVSLGGLAVLAQGFSLRFHIENTEEAMADSTRGGFWLLGSACLLGAGMGLARWSGALWSLAAVLGLPVVAGVVPALLLPGNIIPFGTALVSGVACLGAVVAVVVRVAKR